MKKKKIKKIKLKANVLKALLCVALLAVGITTGVITYSEYVSKFGSNTGIVDNVVYLNDSQADWYYYQGLNYTHNDNGTLPTTTSKNKYDEGNLVKTTITYNGVDISNQLRGYVSLSERQDTFQYYKYYPVYDNGTTNTTDDYILIELIDNPFTDRPVDKGFNGWVTSYRGVNIRFDSDTYTRYAEVPIAYTNGIPNAVEISFHADWVNAEVSFFSQSGSWNNAFGSLNANGMQALGGQRDVYEDVSDYYLRATASRFTNYPTGAVNASGNSVAGNRCSSWSGCTYYIHPSSSEYVEGTTYYELTGTGNNRNMVQRTIEVIGIETLPGLAVNYPLSGYYRQINIARNSSYAGYYSEEGVYQTSGTCNTTGGCTYYELIQYYDEEGNIASAIADETYYYLVTRDTNIIVLNQTVSNVWDSSQNKPFTLTSIYNGTSYVNSAYWSIGTNTINSYDDITIESIRIYSTTTRADGEVTPGATGSLWSQTPDDGSTFFGNWYNVKIGRGIIAYGNNYTTFSTIIGGNGNSTGSSSNVTKYKLIVESGFYNSFGLSTGNSGGTDYIYATGIYGNDYDRAINDNSLLEVRHCASGSWAGTIYGATSTDVALNTIVKSGQFGSNKYDYATGIYVGGRNSGTHNAARQIIVEGGYIYNLIGGPLTNSNRSNYNDTYMYIKGGSIDIVIGGAGRTETYGNRIVQMTGGQVNYSLFGGSNGIEGSDASSSLGTIKGSTYVYVGGIATIGDEQLVANNTMESESQVESGSVFGIGNGRSGDNYEKIGSADNSIVIITDEALVRRNVYAGGNYGAVGINSSSTTSSSTININGGLIKGSVYGGGNNNGSGSSSITSTVSINMTRGTVEGSVYGGSNQKGIIYGSTNVNILGGIVQTSVYGGGRGGYASSSASGTFVSQSSNVTIGNADLDTTPVIRQNVYGGSALGSVNGTTNSTTLSSHNTKVTVNKGTIEGSVFGGGQGNATYIPYVMGNVDVNINGGTILNVFGGNDASGSPNGYVKVYLTGGDITNVYGGGNETGVTTTNIYLRGSHTTNIFGGSNQSGDVNDSNILATSGTATTIYGGNNVGGVTTNSMITVDGGNIHTIYGGGKEAITGTTNVYLNASNIDTVYGGGESANVTIATNVNLAGSTVNNLYGGSHHSGNVPISNIVVTSGKATTLYGGNNIGGVTTDANVTINGGEVTNAYGGGREATTDTTYLNLNAANITNVYGGGESADITTSANIHINGSSIGTLYGGSNQSGNVPISNVIADSGTATTLYGGNNAGGTTITSNITVNNGTITTLYGGGKLATTQTTNIDLNGASITDIYGGGESADVAISTNINLNGSQVGTLYGGSNTLGTVSNSYIKVYSGTVGSIYGGNNQGGSTVNTDIYVNGANINYLYGGGNKANSQNSKIVMTKTNQLVTAIYGGGNLANVDTANIQIQSGMIEKVFGGSNQSGTVKNSNVVIEGVTTSDNPSITMDIVYNAVETASWQSTTYPVIAELDVTFNNHSNQSISEWDASIFIPNSTMYSNYSNSEIIENGDTYLLNEVNRHWGTNAIPANGSYNVKFDVLTTQNKDAFIVGYDLQGTTSNGTTYADNENALIINTVYGGNNAGGKTEAANILIKNGQVTNIFGGGNEAETTSAIVKLENATIFQDVYGGGNQAAIATNVDVDIINSNIAGNLYGGGNAGTVGTNTDVYVSNSQIGASIYAGGNGTTAVVRGNTLLNIDGQTVVNRHVFGGGNAAATGLEEINQSSSEVNIAGATIRGNVYGGANTSVLYGITTVNIGYDTLSNSNLIKGNIVIDGTVFGGGEANASGSEIYDFQFISVTKGIHININGNNHSLFEINGSIFGSGNASSTTGSSTIHIKNYGTKDNYKTNVSIQRTNKLTIDNSYIQILGATDRTNDYSQTLFSLSRIDELKLKNNSTVYLATGANLLQKFTSVVDSNGQEVLAAVDIDDEQGNVTRNVDNRLYMLEGTNLNIATNQNVTAYGEVQGMTFFGMYRLDRNNTITTALYDSEYNYGDSSTELYYFNDGSYVLGLHKANHDYYKNGFYTNVADEENIGYIKTTYIQPTPEDANFYMWVIGTVVASYDIELIASKYSTLGTYEFPLLNFPDPNASFHIVGFNYDGLNSEVELVDEKDIPRIASSGADADNIMSLVMKASNTGWITKGSTTFLTNEASYSGIENYQSENSTVVPSFIFYLYHSKNLASDGAMGTATISLMIIIPIDDLTNHVERININVTLSRALYATNDYEASITSGKEYSMFASSAVNITTKSSFSTYYSLFAESSASIYKAGYHRSLISSFVFPVNTKITMIDLHDSNNPEYYYYVINDNDVESATQEYQSYGEVSYNLSRFIKMGSSNASNHYNDAVANEKYYDSNTGITEEEFIFIVDFQESAIVEDVLQKSLLIELRNETNHTLIAVLGVQQASLSYNLYYNKDAVIDVDLGLNDNSIYIGEAPILTVNTNVKQDIMNSNIIYDTSYFDQKLGIKLSIFDENGIQLNAVDLLGLSFVYNGITYYPRFDGTIRLNITDRVANASSKITIRTANSRLASGKYKIKVESFASPDGIYYGLVSSDYAEIDLTILNTIYGLSVNIDERATIIDKETGNTNKGDNELSFTVRYSSGLNQPNIRMSLLRRDYTAIYTTNYNLVDLQNYVSNTLVTTTAEYQYMLINYPLASNLFTFNLNTNLMTGTYKVVFGLYDGDSFIGEVYQYIIIK